MSTINSPSSISTSSSISTELKISVKICEVCGKPGHGKHFGAYTCRACATFFSRYGPTNRTKPCKKENQCDFLKNGYFNCKKCRLQRCWRVGMKIDKKLQTTRKIQKMKPKTKNRELEIPQSVGVFIGRSNLIIFCAPRSESEKCPKHILDVRFLMDQASSVLKMGIPSPVSSISSLEKLAFGLQQIRRGSRAGKTQFVSKLGKEQILALWQDDMLKVASWMTYFDEFQILPHEIKIKILKGIWRVWSRLERLATTIIGRRNKLCEEKMLMLDLEENQVVFYINKTEIDLSWYSRYNAHQLKLFGYRYLDEKTDDLIEELVNLQPSDVEMSYMMCQLCFYYVGKRYQGVILEIADRLIEVLSNDLHNYYTKQVKTEKYAGRLASMMKINNHIQKGIYQRRAKADLMRIFDVFYVEFSDPEMFIDA